MITTHWPGWVDTTGRQHRHHPRRHVLMVPDAGLAVLAPHLVDYGFVRTLMGRGFKG